MQIDPPLLAIPALLLLAGCACGARSTDTVDADLSADDVSWISDRSAPTEADCESMCFRAAGTNVVEVADCELTINDDAGGDSGDTAGPTGHVTCVATSTNLCE